MPCAFPNLLTRRHASPEPRDNLGPNLEQPAGFRSHLSLFPSGSFPSLSSCLEGTGPGGPQVPFQLSVFYCLSSPVCLIAADFSGARLLC